MARNKKSRTKEPRVGFYIRKPTRDRVNVLKDKLAIIKGAPVTQDEAVWWMLDRAEPELEAQVAAHLDTVAGLNIRPPKAATAPTEPPTS